MNCHLCSKKVSEDIDKKDIYEFWITCGDCYKTQSLYLFDIEQANKKINNILQNIKLLSVDKSHL
jgi:hypothetical protein